jgi:hypothetical protein
MTPQERQRVDELFDRLARLEAGPRDAEAERAIADGLRRAPNAIYPLVQTVLVQDEALKRADARIRELTGEDDGAPAQGGFLDSMRTALTGRPARTSVPTVGVDTDPRVRDTAAPVQGGSFLGTAAASAAGVIGGALLLNTISSMFGHHGGSAFAAVPPPSSPPDQSAAGSDLARQAGIDHIGRGDANGNDRATGLFGANDADKGDLDTGGDDFGDDFGGDFGGDL